MNIKRYFKISNVEKVILFVAIFTLPWNIFLVTKPEWSYWQGHFIDYWAPKLYLTQLLLWFLWGIHLYRQGTTRGKTILKRFFRFFSSSKTLSLSTLIILILIFRQFFTSHPWPALLWFFTFISGPGLLALYLWKKKVPDNLLSSALLTGIGFQALLGILQFFRQAPLGPYWLFGEPSFAYKKDLSISVFSQDVLALPYGSTPHPNILGAWMFLGLLFLWWQRKKLRPLLLISLATLYVLVLLLTESWVVWLTLFWSGTLLFFKRIFLSKSNIFLSHLVFWGSAILFTFGILFLPHDIGGKTRNFWLDSSLSRRQTFISIARREFPRHLWGTGWNQHLSIYSPQDKSLLQAGFIQPIHNVLVIFAIENGLWTLFLIYIFFKIGSKNYSFVNQAILFILPILCLDHYIYTQIQGQYLLIFAIIFMYFINKK